MNKKGTSGILFFLMQIEIYKLRQQLDNCLFSVYFLNSKKYIKYKIKYLTNVSYKYAAKYIPDTNTIVIVDHDFYNFELLLCTALHELSHHIQYTNFGVTNHSKSFKEIHASLLRAAFESGVINPTRLLLSEKYLADYTEERRIVKLCENYIKENENVPIFVLDYKDEILENEKGQYIFNNKLGKYYAFVEIDPVSGCAK